MKRMSQKSPSISREERAARLAARFAGATHYPTAEPLTPAEQHALVDALAHTSGLAAALRDAVAAATPQASPVQVALTVQMILGRLPAARLAHELGEGPVCGVRLLSSDVQAPPAPRPLELAFTAPSARFSTQDLLMLAWHVLRRAVACWEAVSTGEQQFDTAVAQSADDGRAAARAITLQRFHLAAGTLELGLVPVALESGNTFFGGALQVAHDIGKGVRYTLVFSDAAADLAVGGVAAGAFCSELFHAYLVAAMRDIGAAPAPAAD